VCGFRSSLGTAVTLVTGGGEVCGFRLEGRGGRREEHTLTHCCRMRSSLWTALTLVTGAWPAPVSLALALMTNRSPDHRETHSRTTADAPWPIICIASPPHRNELSSAWRVLLGLSFQRAQLPPALL
jgi:hypothetical protein